MLAKRRNLETQSASHLWQTTLRSFRVVGLSWQKVEHVLFLDLLNVFVTELVTLLVHLWQ